jgi:hypothetical protein
MQQSFVSTSVLVFLLAHAASAQGTTLDRYHLQAATSPSPAFQPFALSVGRTPG